MTSSRDDVINHIEDILGSEGTHALAEAMYYLVEDDRVMLHDADEGSYSESEWNTLIDQAQAGIDRKDIIAAILAAQAAWARADWTHERVIAGRIVTELVDGDPVYCDGGDDCETCDEAKRDSRAAAAYGDQAVEAVRCGDLEEGLRLVLRARELEDEWGDSPAWTPAVEAVEAAIRDGE